MRSRNKTIYSVICLGGKKLGIDDLGECLVVSCTNMASLSKITGIRRDRLVYIFTRKGFSVLEENGHLIMKSLGLYMGEERGKRNVERLIGYNRNL